MGEKAEETEQKCLTTVMLWVREKARKSLNCLVQYHIPWTPVLYTRAGLPVPQEFVVVQRPGREIRMVMLVSNGKRWHVFCS